MQIWPWCSQAPQAIADAATSRSASSSTISEFLPPSSSDTFFRWRPASSPTRRPTPVEPVNEIMATSRIGAQRLARLGAAGQHVQHALGQAGLLEGAGDDEAAGQRGLRVGLEHHRVAGSKRRRHTARDRISGKLKGEITPTTPCGTRRA